MRFEISVLKIWDTAIFWGLGLGFGIKDLRFDVCRFGIWHVRFNLGFAHCCLPNLVTLKLNVLEKLGVGNLTPSKPFSHRGRTPKLEHFRTYQPELTLIFRPDKLRHFCTVYKCDRQMHGQNWHSLVRRVVKITHDSSPTAFQYAAYW